MCREILRLSESIIAFKQFCNILQDANEWKYPTPL